MKNLIPSIFLTIIALLWSQLLSPSLFSETLVKTPSGLRPIESIAIHDTLIGYVQDNLINVLVTNILTTTVDTKLTITTNKGIFYATSHQLFFDPVQQQWIQAQKTTLNTHFLDSAFNEHICLTIQQINIPPTKTYELQTTYPHNFFVYDQEFLVHNFIPFVGLAATFLFGGGLEFSGLSILTSIAGTIFGITLLKKKAKSGASFHISSGSGGHTGGAGKDPNDDHDKDKKENCTNRKHNTIDKTTFFKRIKNEYRHWRDGI